MDSQKMQNFQSPEYKRSRAAYTLECAFEYFVAILVSDAFLPKLLTSLGMPDSLTGITSSIISLSFLFQLFAVLIAQRIRNTKRFASLFHCLGQLFFMFLYLVPFLPFAAPYRHILVIVCLVVAYFGNYLVTTVIYKWGNSYVEPHKRGNFSAVKETISLLSGMAVSLVCGYAMDAFEANNNLEGGFLFAAIGILVFVICDFICLLLIKNDVRPKNEPVESVSMREVFSGTLKNKNFRNVIILGILWTCAVYTSLGFLGSYRLKELAFTLGTVQIFSVVASFSRAMISKPFGKYSDKHTYAKGVELGLLFAAVAFAINIFTTPGTRYLMLVFTVLYNVCQAGVSANMVNMTYSYVDSKYFVQASAIKNSIGGVCGFLASLGAGKLLDLVQKNGNRIFGIPMYGQQLLSLISLVLVVAAILYTKLVIQKQKVMIQ